MANTTAILKAAASARKRVLAQQDAEAAFEWENSAQTYEDYVNYSQYLQDRQQTTSDPSQALSYDRTLRSARRSYTSNELQRQQMAIIEGRATTADKMDLVKDLFYQAQENGDHNLAQNLLSQWDTLSVKLQNEQETAARAFSSSSKKVKDAFIKDLTKGVDDVTLPSGEKVTPLAQITRHFQETGDTVGSMKAAQDTLEAIRNTIIDQYNNATSQEEVDALEEKYGGGLADIDTVIKISLGGKNLSAQEVMNGIANDQMNNPKYSLEAVRNEATGKNEFKLKVNNIDNLDYVRQFDPTTGEEYYVPATIRTDQEKLMFGTSDQGRGLKTQITDKGEVIGADEKGSGAINAGSGKVKRDESQTIENRLKSLGIIATTDGTTLKIKLPGESVARSASIQPDGSIRYYGDDGQLNEIGLVDRNLGSNDLPQNIKAGEVRVVSPDEISDFGRASAFGGTLSQGSREGERYLDDITGRTTAPSELIRGSIRTGNDFSGRGTAAVGGNLQGSTGILQSAAAVRKELQLQAQKQQMLQAQAEAAQRLQASNTFNLNQTPVAQFASNGVLKRQLSVAAPQRQARVVVAPPAPTPNITRVTVAQPGKISGVGVAKPTGTVRVR